MGTNAGATGGLSQRARRRVAWGLPVVVAGAVVAGTAVAATSASGAPTLPGRTPAQLIAAVEQSSAGALSGQLEEIANLGIPSLPGDQSSASLSWQTFLTGTHAARVWADGPSKQRIALLGELSEADVTHNGSDLWTYTSDTNTVTHSVLPSKAAAHAETTPAADGTPAAMAAELLKSINPSTSVTVETAQRVAHRSAYTLVLRPRDTRSTVREAKIAIDAKKYVPLRVQLFGAGSSPALSVGFTSISFSRPSAATFAFHAPAGATVSDNPFGPREHGRYGDHKRSAHTVPQTTRPAGPAGSGPTSSGTGPVGSTKVVGTGWTSVLESSGGANGLSLGNGTLGRLTTATATPGQRLLHTALLNAVFRPDGRVFVGAVSPKLLEHIAATTH